MGLSKKSAGRLCQARMGRRVLFALSKRLGITNDQRDRLQHKYYTTCIHTYAQLPEAMLVVIADDGLQTLQAVRIPCHTLRIYP